MSTPTSRKGFTLIELLVVIAIIGVLASVVLASLNSARERAHHATRLSQMKEVQKALELYHLNNGTYPPEASDYRLENMSGLAPTYISVLPNDPTPPRYYAYGRSDPSGQGYTLLVWDQDANTWCTIRHGVQQHWLTQGYEECAS